MPHDDASQPASSPDHPLLEAWLSGRCSPNELLHLATEQGAARTREVARKLVLITSRLQSNQAYTYGAGHQARRIAGAMRIPGNWEQAEEALIAFERQEAELAARAEERRRGAAAGI